MARKPRKPSPSQVKAAADRAEGLAPPPASVGRPTSYNPKFAEQAQKLCKLGATDQELAEFFEVATSTIWRWASAHEEFCSALKAGKAECDERVTRSLFHRAVGYTFDSEKVFQYQGEIIRAKTKEHVPPDTTAAIFWLKNRRQQEWRDVHKHEHGQPGDFDRMDPGQLRDFIRREAEALGVGMPGFEAEGSGDQIIPTIPGHGTA